MYGQLTYLATMDQLIYGYMLLVLESMHEGKGSLVYDGQSYTVYVINRQEVKPEKE